DLEPAVCGVAGSDAAFVDGEAGVGGDVRALVASGLVAVVGGFSAAAQQQRRREDNDERRDVSFVWCFGVHGLRVRRGGGTAVERRGRGGRTVPFDGTGGPSRERDSL